MSQQKPTYFYPNNMARIILLAMTDVLGRNGINAVLNLTNLPSLINNFPPNNFDLQFKFDDLSRIIAGIESYYGPRGGRGLALRSGQACFKYGLREFGPLLGVSDLAFRLLPLPKKMKTGAELFAQAFNKFSDQRVRLEETEDQILWRIERCPVCWQRETEEPSCHLAVGILQEALYWISGGKNFNVVETACIAVGDSTCTIEISKTPLS